MEFPKPVKQPKERYRWKRKADREARRTKPGLLPYEKEALVRDPKLLASYRGRPCVACGETFGTTAHHYINRSKVRLDIPENLDPFCMACHERIERGDTEFELKHLARKGPVAIARLRELRPKAGILVRLEEHLSETL